MKKPGSVWVCGSAVAGLDRGKLSKKCVPERNRQETSKKLKRNRARKPKETRKEIVRETHQDTVKQTRKKHGKKPEGNLAKTLNMH